MCQLLGMNCTTPTDICISFEVFRNRGGLTDEHRDGWGIAFFEGPGCRTFLDVQSSVDSPVAELVRQYPIRSKNVIAHIRKATHGSVTLENTHPFQRELWGRYWAFAHNGTLHDFAPVLDDDFRPVGDTDSERAFCHILQSLRRRHPTAPPAPDVLFDDLRELAAGIAKHGTFNFLLSNGDCLFAHCSTKLSCITRQAPFVAAHLKDFDVSIDLAPGGPASTADSMTLIATLPLTDDAGWTTLTPGTLTLFDGGTLRRSAPTAVADARLTAGDPAEFIEKRKSDRQIYSVRGELVEP